MLHQLIKLPGERKRKKRIGRGVGSGHGKTCGKGHKGQNARSGASRTIGFEGGQMPIYRRLPKRGFTNINKKKYILINLQQLNDNKYVREYMEHSKDAINRSFLEEHKIINKKNVDGIKLLSDGDITFPLNIEVSKASKKAIEKINLQQGKVIVVKQ